MKVISWLATTLAVVCLVWVVATWAAVHGRSAPGTTAADLALQRLASASWDCVAPPERVDGRPATDMYSIDMVSQSLGWALSGNEIIKYDGADWVFDTSPVTVTAVLSGLDMVSSSDGWIVGERGVILHYDNGTWEVASSPTGAALWAVSMVSAGDGWIVGTGGEILHFTGGAWVGAISPTEHTLLDIDMVSSQEGWAVGMEGTILHFTSGSWQVVDSPTSERLSAVDMASASAGWAVGVSDGTMAAIARYSDGSWELQANDVADLSAVSAVSESEAWAAGINDTMLHYTDGEWQQAAIPECRPYCYFADIDMLSGDEGWAVGQCALSALLMHYTQGSVTHGDERSLPLPWVSR
jgi:photosystem II stability/assembly factor-like uncharacterized protein